MATFHVLSDLHLEMFPGFRLDPAQVTEPNLILAGDIADPSADEYRLFLGHCSQLFERVFVILGNHEMYGSSVEEATSAARNVCDSLPNVHLLTRSHFDVGSEVRIIGTTLWSKIPKSEAFSVGCFIGDFRHIRGLDVYKYNYLHATDVEWLDSEISRAAHDGKRLLVVTHHAPIVRGASLPEHTLSPLNCAFATDLRHLLVEPVSVWVHGHTHHSHDTMSGTCRVVANQRGYADDPSEGKGFDLYKIVRVV
jgi:3',5'-cyclic AMP phosphodiesterase CpdA